MEKFNFYLIQVSWNASVTALKSNQIVSQLFRKVVFNCWPEYTNLVVFQTINYISDTDIQKRMLKPRGAECALCAPSRCGLHQTGCILHISVCEMLTALPCPSTPELPRRVLRGTALEQLECGTQPREGSSQMVIDCKPSIFIY